MSYSSKGLVQNYLTIDIDSSFDTQIESWAVAVDNYIDRYCNRSFDVSAQGTKYFDGNGTKELDVDDFTAINSITILEPNSDNTMHTLTEGRENDYLIYPYNTSPKYRLVLTPVAVIGVWPHGNKRIVIDADWGRGSTPDDIKLAATMLLAGIVEKGLKGGSVLSESLGDYNVTFKNVDDISSVMGVKEILSKYKLWEL